MYETIFTLDPASTAQHRVVAMILFASVLLVCAGLVVRLGWRSWWVVAIVGICLPTIIVLPFGGARITELPLLDFVLDVTVPLALVGLPAAAMGSVLGAMVRWLARRISI